MSNLDDMGSDYPMGDEKTYQNRKKYGSSVHPNSSVAKMYKRLKEGTSKPSSRQGTSDGYMVGKKMKGEGEYSKIKFAPKSKKEERLFNKTFRSKTS